MYRILLVDDEILVREAIKENIDWAALDCQLVGVCENGQEAAEFVRKQPVDIVLTDILMPYMDGMELSHFLHDHYPDIVIVVFSGFGEFEYAKKAIQYNVSEYMLKPVTAMELREVIGKMKVKVDQRREEKQRLERLTKKSKGYQKNAHIIRSKALEALVNCTKELDESLEELRDNGVVLSAASYRVAAFDLDLYSGLYQLDTEKHQESALMSFVLFNVSDEIVTRERAGIVYQEGNNRVCVLFTGKDSREFSGKITRICREIQSKLREMMGMEVSIGIGCWVHTLKQLVISSQSAGKALQYRYLLGGNLLFDMEKEAVDQPLLLQECLTRLVYAMKIGNKEGMELALAKIEEDIKAARVDKSCACVYLQQVIRAVDQARESITTEMDTFFEKRERLIRKVTEQKTFQSAIRIVKEFAEEIFEELSQVNGSSNHRQALRALDYIQNHYMDSSLSLSDICAHLNISTSYFSMIFKEETGGTFTEVLIKTRMQKAMELLENTTLKNYEIAEKVGFSDPHYFGISFKKMTGKTPTEYAREKRK